MGELSSRRWISAAAGGTAAMIIAAGCSSGSGPRPSAAGAPSTSAASSAGAVHDGGQIVVGLPAAPAALDPTTESTYYGRIVFADMCLGLYGIDAQSRPAPVLAAAAPTVGSGGTVLTIPIRQNVAFNDGTPLDAQAVVTSLQRDMTLATSARAPALADVQSVMATDASTVQLTLKKPDSALPTILAGRSGIVMSPTALSKEGSNFSQDPVCVGPYSFGSRPSQDQILLKKSPYFYDKAKVHADSIEFTVINDPSTCYSNLLSGAINVAACLSPNDVNLLTHNSSYQVSTVVTNAYGGIDINVDNGNGYKSPPTPADDPLATNPSLRKAFEMSISRNAINKVVFAGVNKVNCTPLAPGSPYASPVTCTHRDINQAKALVQASGVPTPIHLTLTVPTGTLNTEEGELIASEAAPAGFDIKVQPTEFTTALSAAQSGKYQMFAIGWSGRVDPDQNIAPFYTPGSALNYTGVQDPTLISLLAQGREEQTLSARRSTYAQVVQHLGQDLGIVYLYNEAFQLASTAKLSGVTFTPDGIIHLTSAGFTG